MASRSLNDTSATCVVIDLVPVTNGHPDSQARPQCLHQDGSPAAAAGTMAPEAGATPAMNASRLGRPPHELASQSTLWKGSLYRSITSTFAGLSRNTLCHLFLPVRELCQQKQGLLGKILLVATFLATVLMMWPSMQSAVDTRKSLALARWTALKDFFELCEAHNWELPACEATTKVAPGPPPDVKPRDLKHEDPMISGISIQSELLALVGISCLMFSIALAATTREAECLHCRGTRSNPTAGPHVKVELSPITQRKIKQPVSLLQRTKTSQEQADGRSTTVDTAFSPLVLPALSDGSLHKRRRTVIGEALRYPKLACPYFKNNPSMFAHTHACSGPGWDGVHRVKEHLYRRHELPRFRCNRCWGSFSDELHLAEHHETELTCTVNLNRLHNTEDGFNEDQKKQLRSPLKKNMSEVDKWKKVYSILFRIPENSPEIPSPYYE